MKESGLKKKETLIISGKGGVSACVIGKGSRLEGTLSCVGLLRLEGECVGKLGATGTLVIAEGAKADAEIEADDVIVAGTVNGSIVGRNFVRLTASAKVKADIQSPRFKLEDGALFLGAVSGAIGSGKAV
ncbi:MAG TPA: polymer-forming cytoskeletal protein [Rectinemataceae bacterium]|nr:polymer-forming cytoskeletal protein [Rectinemataceae bacterium]